MTMQPLTISAGSAISPCSTTSWYQEAKSSFRAVMRDSAICGVNLHCMVGLPACQAAFCIASAPLYLRHWPLMALKLLLVLLASAPFAFPQGSGLPAKESFSYNIEWRLFAAGKARADIT